MKKSVKKAIFQLKLAGAYDVLIKHAYAHGFTHGHKFGKHFGNLEAGDIEEAYVEYKKQLDEDVNA